MAKISDWYVYSRYMQGSYGSWKTGKVLEFYYGIFQDWKVLEKGYWSWKVLEICLTQLKNVKCMKGSKKNWHWDLGSIGVNANFRALKKPVWVLEKFWKSPENLFLKRVRRLFNMGWCTYHSSSCRCIKSYYTNSRILSRLCTTYHCLPSSGKKYFIYITIGHIDECYYVSTTALQSNASISMCNELTDPTQSSRNKHFIANEPSRAKTRGWRGGSIIEPCVLRKKSRVLVR